MLSVDPQRAYRAVTSRDRRFDGLFYVGVTTTGVYCRPICPARTPRADRCTYHATAALAEAAGFRACFRCRPELAPGHASIDRASVLATEAGRRIELGALDGEGSLEALAAELGVTSRHLRRVLQDELGVGPHALAESRRLATAKALLTDSGLGMAQIAFASGFSSVRRFNDAFKKRFGAPPRRLGGGTVRDVATLRLKLAYRPPLDWRGLLDYLGPRAIAGVEEVRGGTWRRVVVHSEAAGVIEVRHDGDAGMLVATVPAALSGAVRTLVPRLRATFDLDAQPGPIAAALRPGLAARVKAAPGLRVPGCLDGLELAVRAILGQQVSVRGASTLASRLVERFGTRHATGDALDRSFPSAASLAHHTAAQIASIGLPLARAETIRRLAERVAAGEVNLDGPLHHATAIENAIATLKAQPGIGPWTAEYVAMRALRWPDAFVAGDLGVQKALGAMSGGARVTEREARERAEAFRPYRAYAVLHLWRSLGSPLPSPRRKKP